MRYEPKHERMTVTHIEKLGEGAFHDTDDIVLDWDGETFWLQRVALKPSERELVQIGDVIEFTSEFGMAALSFGESFSATIVK